jgi:hypothetical protein
MLALTSLLGAALGPAATTYAASAPPNFQVTPVFNGLKNPTDFQFAADGRVFVSEKAGTIKVFDSLIDTTPTVFADLSTQVYKGPNDHGILGLALDPSFPSQPYVYVLYTYDAPIGGTAPRWNDVCPDPPGSNTNGCVVSGRLSRLQAVGNLMTGSEQVLIEGWCQQFTSHSIGCRQELSGRANLLWLCYDGVCNNPVYSPPTGGSQESYHRCHPNRTLGHDQD